MSTHPSFRSGHRPPSTFTKTAAQLARLPEGDGRSSERRVVNLAADLREPGSVMVDIEVGDLSTDGFMMRCDLEVEPGAIVWLKLPGFAPTKSEVIWSQDGKAGCRFAVPLYPAELETIIESQPKRDIKRLFTPPTAPIPVERPEAANGNQAA
jgi:hypothetical protein